MIRLVTRRQFTRDYAKGLKLSKRKIENRLWES